MRLGTLFALAVLLGCTACVSGAPSLTQSFARPSATIERASTRASLLKNAPAAPPLAGKFVFAPGDGSIWLQDPADGRPRPLITPTPEMFADAPNFSPDGKRIVYVRSTLTGQGAAQYAIHTINVDGSDDRAIAIPPDPKTAFNWPSYSADGKWIYYTASYPVPPNKQHSEIQRIPVEGGAPVTLVTDARNADASPDGRYIAFLRFNFDTFSAGLWIADGDGQNARPLLGDDVFLMIAAPLFSPNGSEILFVASGPNMRPLPGVSSRMPSCEPGLLCWFAKPALADGLPWDLWTVTSDGRRFTRLTKVGADSPWPAWSRDGRQIAFFDPSGQYLLDLPSKVVSEISRNGGHGVFDWWQP